MLALIGCGGSGSGSGAKSTQPDLFQGGIVIVGSSQEVSGYTTQTLVSTFVTTADHSDENLIDPVGLSFATGAPVWVANNRSNVLTLYDGHGVRQQPIVSVPGGLRGKANPTGIVSTSGANFTINSTLGSASFVLCGETGLIAAWAPSAGTSAVKVYEDLTAVYEALAIATQGGDNLLYATDFRNNKIDVFNSRFEKIAVAGNFEDAALPAGFAPFGIQAINNRIYVAYAKQLAPDKGEATAGAGLGYLNIFQSDGVLLARMIAGGPLNAPWGIAPAPSNFGKFSGALLVANSGDGVINVFDSINGSALGTLQTASGNTIVIPGLRGIAFGNGVMSQSVSTLFFTAGPGNGASGIYGSIAAISTGSPSTVPAPLGH